MLFLVFSVCITIQNSHSAAQHPIYRARGLNTYFLSLWCAIFVAWKVCEYISFTHLLKELFNRWANPGLFFVYFRPFLITISIIQIEKSIDGVHGIWTRGCRMAGADKTTELWRPSTCVDIGNHHWQDKHVRSSLQGLCRQYT